MPGKSIMNIFFQVMYRLNGSMFVFSLYMPL